MDQHKKYLKKAIELAAASVDQGGGPFGAVIVCQNRIISQTSNQVTLRKDPTAHAEILAIREACNHLNDVGLHNCTLYASCEPCPMCLGAIYWARIPAVIFASSRTDAAKAGFDDQIIYEEFSGQNTHINLKKEHLSIDGSSLPFQKWLKKTDKTLY